MKFDLQFVLILLITVVIMEAVAYVAHRYLFHGVLWSMHRSHHEPRKGRFELNDAFGLIFAAISILCMGGWMAPDLVGITFPIGTGMTVYGAIYFFLHDVYTHRRIYSMTSRNRWLQEMRAAHRRHHSNVSREGQEPYGFVHFRTFESISSPDPKST